MSEFRIRREFEGLKEVPMPTVRKVRSLLRLAHQARKGAVQLGRLSYTMMQANDGARSMRFRNASQRLFELHDEIRGAARKLLNHQEQPLAFDNIPPASAYPRWSEQTIRTPEVVA